MPPTVQLDSPGIAKMVQQLGALLKQDRDLRALQAANAQQASNFDQPGFFTQVGSVLVTGPVIYRIEEAQRSQTKPFSLLTLIFESGSGSGRWRMDGGAPTPTVGMQVPAGGIVLNIPGWDAIQKFQLTAEGGQTLLFGRYLFI